MGGSASINLASKRSDSNHTSEPIATDALTARSNYTMQIANGHPEETRPEEAPRDVFKKEDANKKRKQRETVGSEHNASHTTTTTAAVAHGNSKRIKPSEKAVSTSDRILDNTLPDRRPQGATASTAIGDSTKPSQAQQHSHNTRQVKKPPTDDLQDANSIQQAAMILKSLPLKTYGSSQMQSPQSSLPPNGPTESLMMQGNSTERGRRTKQLPRPRREPETTLQQQGDRTPPQVSGAGIAEPNDAVQQELFAAKSVPLAPLPASRFQGDAEAVMAAPMPDFCALINFPAGISVDRFGDPPPGMRWCVMCGDARRFTKANKGIKSKKSDGSSNGQDSDEDSRVIIPTQNKGMCTLCDVKVWLFLPANLQIKWCKGCKNFRPWAAFGEKGLATKCQACRERQQMRYAQQKNESRLQAVAQDN